MTAMLRAAAVALFSFALSLTSLHAQQIEITGRGDAQNDAFLRRILDRPDLVLITSDTVLGRTDTITGTVLVVAATARIDGVIAGDLVVVDGNVFLRPNARVLGRVFNVSGGLYPSELAVVGGGIQSDPNAPYRADRREDGVIVIRGTSEQTWLRLDGVYGLTPPTYDRVDGVTATFGAGILLPRIELIEPMLHGHVDYRSQRGEITGGAELRITRGRSHLIAGVDRTTITNEQWIRSDLMNTLSFLVQGNDHRDYYAAERVYAEARRTLGKDTRATTAFLRAQIEDAKTLGAREPWTLFGSPRTDNLPVVEERIASVTAGVRLDWAHPQHIIGLDGALEFAGELLDGTQSFNRYIVDAEWAMAGFRDHTLELDLHFQGPLPGTESLPPQRWTFLGGSPTLYTDSIAEFRGDRAVSVRTMYSIPLPARFRLRVLGLPSLELMHMTGMAWSAGQARRFRQNIGVLLRYNVVYVRAITNPSHFTEDIEFTVGVSLPQRARPWQAPR